MWFTEIKGVVESLEPNSSYLLVIHQNSVSAQGNNLCADLGRPYDDDRRRVDPSLNNVRNRDALGDLGIFTSDRNGIAAVNLNTLYTSLFGGPGTISGRALAVSLIVTLNDRVFSKLNSTFFAAQVYKLKGDEVILKPVHCGMIKLPSYAPAHFQSDANALQVKKVNSSSSFSRVSSTTTKEPDFDRPPIA